MKVKDIEFYESWKSKNRCMYGLGIFNYVERWANLMENEIAKGAKVSDIAGKLSREADTEGITGYMYGASVSILSQCWEHGDELRRWHYKEYGYEG
ncbi:hypothetical protein P9G40_19180 [Bacillus velezensis]|uniref:hypothetical protein n=1 Tax=Bacillus velezensis TaxID=492670 RepID=UPI001ABDACEA|nr:hypothetical protein [Bacillus velezensis]MBO3789628.1 hypothetical protein [Bacillus velezensis]MEC2153293.1 hypothetical protein [Bacillus velezensis]MEC2157268.1 hypothetical protein [Bacillus velezensis]